MNELSGEATDELATLKAENERLKDIVRKCNRDWYRLKDFIIGCNGPGEMIRFQEAAWKNNGKGVEMFLSYLDSLWLELDKAKLTDCRRRQRLSEKEMMKSKAKPERKSGAAVRVQRVVRPLVVDGWEFDAPLDAALHLLWLLQRLSYYEKHREGQPCDGFRFREGIIAARKLLRKLKYEPGEAKRHNDQAQRSDECNNDSRQPRRAEEA